MFKLFLQIKSIWRIALLVSVLTPSALVLGSANVLTYHNDPARTGLNTNETILTPANVNAANFTRLFTLPVDGYVYAQPLVVTNVTFPNLGEVHDVVYVATEHDSVYAFDANNSGSPLWQVSFINPAAGITTVTSDDVNCDDLVPEVGITSTPVIDPDSGTIYVCARTKEVVGSVTNYFHRLHALDLGTGAEKFGGPVEVTANVAGSGDGTDGAGHVAFNPLTQFNRTSLLLNQGVVYVGSAAHCDNGPYHGWLLGYGAQTLTLNNAFNTTPNGGMGGIWMAGCGPACDANGNIYVITGNGTFDPTPGVNCFGDSFLKLSTTNGLKVADYFTPYDQAFLSSADLDLGSGGALVLPDEVGSAANRHLLVGAGKEGTIYLISRDNMRHYSAANNNAIVQSLTGIIGECFCTPAYFNKKIYWLGTGDILKAFTITNGHLSTSPTLQANTTFGFPGATPSISANGTNNGIVWALQTDDYKNNGPAVLHAYDANNLSVELYNSSQAGGRDQAGIAVKFTVPTIANGKVFVGGQYSLSVYGLGTALSTPVINPSSGVFANSAYVTISESSPGTAIYYTLDGTTPTTSAIPYTGQFQITDSTHIAARAFATGAFDSGIGTADITVIHPNIDTINPSCSILSPTSGQRWSNAVFNATGRAGDNQAVANVYYNLNNNGWNSAATGDSWANWSASFTLSPGTNTLYAYAIDSAGNQSSTDSATINYIAYESLPVCFDSNSGTISPNYKNASLQIGANYTMTATAKAGYAFVNWMDNSGYVLRNKPAIKFTMTSGLALVANFIDISRPTASITNLPANGVVSNDLFIIQGKAADNVGVANVYYNLNDYGWYVANSDNNYASWSGLVDLKPGTNFITVSANDAAGNYSIKTTNRIIYIVSGAITIRTNINGGGITPNYNNTLLQIGMNYTVTATPKPGFLFTNWTDNNNSVVTNTATLKFTMSSNLLFTANFTDIGKPLVSIANIPVTGMISNSLFSIKGKASDNLAVANVYYNLNDSGWNSADTTNNWTNWTGLVSLNPGTNYIAISAKDDAGNYSISNSFRLIYVVSGILTINTNGKGYISPVGNGALLQIGKEYTLAATPGIGFVFSSWSDASSTLATNKPALKFVMKSNLVLTAHFVDVSKPVLSVLSPLSSTIATAEYFNVIGKAADNAAVADVRYQINNGAWYSANTTNNWINWMVTLDLTPGTNYFAAYATDTSGNVSLTNLVKFIYKTAPDSLIGLKAEITPDGGTTSEMAFGAGVFSQNSSDLNNPNGVGVYAYTKLNPNTGLLKTTFTRPPRLTNDVNAATQVLNLYFGAPSQARYINTNNGNTGGIIFASTPTLAPPNLFNQTVVVVDENGGGNSTRFTLVQSIESDLLTHITNAPISYAYAPYGPLTGLIRQTGSNGVAYTFATARGTNYGTTYSEAYDLSGNMTGARQGVFGLASQRKSGNSPTNLISRGALVTSPGDRFSLSFDVNSFTQLDANNHSIIEGTGSYDYILVDTNTGILNLNFTSSSQTSSALFMFASPNFAVFTNLDTTMGTAIFK